MNKQKKISLEDLQRRGGVKTTPWSRAILGFLCVAALIAGIFAIASSVGKSKELPENEKIIRSLSGKSVEEDRRDAVSAAISLLESTGAPATREEAQPRIEAMDQGDFTDFSKDFSSRIRFYDSYAGNTGFQQEVGIGLFSMATIARESNESGKIIADSSKIGTVRIDQETGIAQVPIEIFTGMESPVAFEMIYIDGTWLLEPHSFSSYIRLSAALQGTTE